MEERLTELETKISFQDQIIEDLNKVVIELRAEVERLTKQCEKISKILEEDNIKDASLEEPPPHY
ncbi:MAG: SlyX family protein [Pseudomonadota bacterium]